MQDGRDSLRFVGYFPSLIPLAESLLANFDEVPIYLDHVILPTLTDAGCYTEVHHIDVTGNDAG